MNAFTKTTALIQKGVTDGLYPGAVFSTGDKNGELYRIHYGYRALYPVKEAMEPDTLFDMASVSKLMSTTMVILRLIDAGRLRLSDTLGMYFETHEDKKDITIQQLMSHTSGLPAHILLEAETEDPSKVFHVILQLPLLYKPGTEVTYSCLGYIILGKICEIVTSVGLERLAHEQVFEPLGLTSAGYNPDPANGNIAKTEYNEALGTWLRGIVHDENARFMRGIAGNAGVFAGIGDCVTFAVMLANGGRTADKTFISRALFQESIKNHTASLSEGRGLGFAHNLSSSHPLFGHNGFTGTSLWIDAKTSQYILLLTNRVHPSRENQRLIPFRDIVHHTCITEYSTAVCQ